MATKKRHIDIISTELKFVDDSVEKTTFSSILKFMNHKEYRYQEKIFELSLIKSSLNNCIVGIIVTTQDKDIPPIRNKNTKEYSQILINPKTQGLAFANIFLYDEQRNILLYEINKNGCFINQLKDFIYSKWNSENEDVRFDLSFPAIYRKHEYDRMLKMDYYKRISIELYNPSELIDCFNEENDSIQNNIIRQNIKAGKESNANSIKIEQIALQKKINPQGLNRGMIKGFVDAIKLNIASKGFRRNINTLKVEGYTSDAEGSGNLKPINILADTFNEYFRIKEIQLQSDVQQNERKEGIEKLYSKLLPELKQLKG